MDWFVKKLAGSWESFIPAVGEFKTKLSPEALKMLHEAFSDLEGQERE